MFHSSHPKELLILTGLIVLICACNFPLYPQPLDVKIDPVDEMTGGLKSSPTETPLPASPALPRDGLIILETDRDGNREIYSLNADGSNPINLSRDPSEDWMIDCSPDGQWVLYTSVNENSMDINLMNIWGKEKNLLFMLPGQEAYGLWLDPNAIYLDVYNDTISTTYLLTREEASWEIEQVPTDATAELIPKYRNFGGAILETRVENYGETDLDFEIFLTKGNIEKNLTNHPAWDLRPMWSADGKQILFTSDRNQEKNDLFLMDPEGNILQQLTQNDANDEAFCWIHN